MNRRTFVKGASLGTAGMVAAGALSGIALADEKAAAPASDAAPSTNPSWLGEEPVIDAADIVATYDCDILICGAGCAGIAAAATASELGLNFICCDKALNVPETREYFGAVNTTASLATGNEVDPLKLQNELVRYSSGKANRDLIRQWIDCSAETFDWVDPILAAAEKPCVVDTPQGQGAGGTDFYEPFVQHMWQPSYVPPTRNDLLYQKMLGEGNDIWFGYELVRLVHEDGKVTGGVFKCEDGYVQINATYTVLACGGYPANPEMMEALQSDAVRVTTANSYNAFCDGSGIKCAMWAGASKQADPTPMLFDRGAVAPGVSAGYVEKDGKKDWPGTIFQFNMGSQAFMKVNREGVRFCNESAPYDQICFALGNQPGGVFCQVFDGNAADDIRRFVSTGCAAGTREELDAGFDIDGIIELEGAKDVVMKADTLEELAEKLGFEGDAKDTFLATCERYNGFFDAQSDEDYGKEAYRLSELRTPPFYGCWFGASLLTTLDGIEINAKMQALAADRTPIEGLYAIGDNSGSFFATNYPEYIVGVACGRSVTQGRQLMKQISSDPAFAPTEKTAVKPSGEVDLSAIADGTYTGTGTGMGGDINVTVEVSGGHITVTDISPNNETQGIGGYEAIEDGTYAQQVEDAQGADIDGVAGATVTSKAIEAAVRSALKQAVK